MVVAEVVVASTPIMFWKVKFWRVEELLTNRLVVQRFVVVAKVDHTDEPVPLPTSTVLMSGVEAVIPNLASTASMAPFSLVWREEWDTVATLSVAPGLGRVEVVSREVG